MAHKQKEIKDAVEAQLVALGIQSYRFTIAKGSSHQIAIFKVGSRRRKFHFALTPKSSNAHKQVCCRLRRKVAEWRDA